MTPARVNFLVLCSLMCALAPAARAQETAQRQQDQIERACNPHDPQRGGQAREKSADAERDS